MAKRITTVEPVSNETRSIITRKTVHTLPDNPTEKGYGAEEIKSRIADPVVGQKNSVISELNRVVGEVNRAIEEVDGLIDSTVGKDAVQPVITADLTAVPSSFPAEVIQTGTLEAPHFSFYIPVSSELKVADPATQEGASKVQFMPSDWKGEIPPYTLTVFSHEVAESTHLKHFIGKTPFLSGHLMAEKDLNGFDVPDGSGFEVGNDGTIVFYSNIKFGGFAVISGGVASAIDGDARQMADTASTDLATHKNNATAHATVEDRATWNAKATSEDISSSITTHNQDETSHSDIREILNQSIGLPEYDPTTYRATFRTHDGASTTLDFPIEDLLEDLDYDSVAKEIVGKKRDGTEFRIPVQDWIDIYTGGQTDEIAVSTSADNIITAVLRDGSIGFSRLNQALKDKIDSKADSLTSATKSELESHTQSANNPHGVTAQQTGAVSSSGGTISGNLDVEGELKENGSRVYTVNNPPPSGVATKFVSSITPAMFLGSSPPYFYTVNAVEHGKGVNCVAFIKEFDEKPTVDSSGNVTVYSNVKTNLTLLIL